MKTVKNEKGYALFITVFIIVLFSILAVSLITIVLSGANKNTARENTMQAVELSDKGLEHIINQINYDLQSNIPEKGISEKQFNDLFNSILEKYKCPNEHSGEFPIKDNKNTETGTYKSCVEPSWDKDASMKEIEIHSFGEVNGKEKEFKTTVLMGSDGMPVPLKYVLSTNASEECINDDKNCINGEGNLFLHGGTTITGDMKVDRNLIISDKAYTPARVNEYIFTEAYWLDSILPAAIDSELELGESLYYYKSYNHSSGKQNKINYENHINMNHFNSNSNYIPYDIEDVDEVFLANHVPEIGSKQYFQDDIKITENIQEFQYGPNDHNVIEISSSDFDLLDILSLGDRVFRNIGNHHQRYLPLYGYHCAVELFDLCLTGKSYNGKFYLIGNNNNIHKFAVKQDLHIGVNFFELSNASLINRILGYVQGIKVNIHEGYDGQQGGLYVGGDLIIGSGLTSDLKASFTDPNLKVEINGNVFVNGDLTITDVDGNFNSIMYVNGDVTIDRSKIRSDNGSLIIFANGKINITKNRMFRNEPDVLKGFFYSKEGIEIFASASNLKIVGGLSAPKVVLNSIRGRAGIIGGNVLGNGITGRFEPAQRKNFGIFSMYYETKHNQLGKSSRLELEYDEEILNTYSDLSVDNKIYNVVEPAIITRDEIKN